MVRLKSLVMSMGLRVDDDELYPSFYSIELLSDTDNDELLFLSMALLVLLLHTFCFSCFTSCITISDSRIDNSHLPSFLGDQYTALLIANLHRLPYTDNNFEPMISYRLSGCHFFVSLMQPPTMTFSSYILG